MKDFLAQAAKLLKRQKQNKRQMVIFLCLAAIVTFGTVTALKLYGQAMTHQVEVLNCQYRVHEHTEECYERDAEGNLGTELICGYADYAVHVHNDSCYDKKGDLVCTLMEHEKHEHTDECYETELVLICGLEETADAPEDNADGATESAPDEAGQTGTDSAPAESTESPEGTGDEAAESPEGSSAAQEQVLICQEEAHAHSEGCYEKELTCGVEEEHVHSEVCTSRELTCGAEEHAHSEACTTQELTCTVAEHTHGEGCLDEAGNLVCTEQEHTHSEACYTATNTCGKEEHAHSEACYTTSNICGKEEHTHNDSCYTSNLICGHEEHEHTESCYEAAPAPEDGEGTAQGASTEDGTPEAEPTESTEPEDPADTEPEESEAPGHVHTEACYEEVKTLICGEQELHTHDNSCYGEECFDEDGNLIEGSRPSCGLLQLEEHIHVHTDGEDSCFQTVELTPEEIAALENGAKLHIHTEECYDEEGNLICGHDATHIHMPQCYDDAGELICGYGTAAHVHEDKCYDEEGNLVCGYETAKHVHEESCYDAEGNLQCGYETASHVHGKECYDEEGNLTCGYEAAAHVHEESCYDADGNLICGYGTLLDTEDTVKLDGTFTYEAEDYTLEIHVQTDIPSDSIESDAPVSDAPVEEPAEADGSAEEPTESDAPVESAADGEDEGTEEKAESGSEAETPGTEEGSGTDAADPAEAESQPATDDDGQEPGQEDSASGIEELSEVHEGDGDTTVPETEESQDGTEDVPEGTDSDQTEGQPEQNAQILLTDEASGLTLRMVPVAAGAGLHAEMADYVEGIGGSRLLDLSVMELHVYRDGKEIDISDCTVAVNITPKAVTVEEMVEAFGEEAAAEEGNGIIVSALQKTADGVRGSGNVFLTPDMEEVPVLQNVVAENGVLAIARYVGNETITKTFQGESFIVTATYRPDANIPAEAQLLAEQITEESNSEHYAKRQAEYQEALGDETATMRALMKIGFYVEDENGEFTTEVEPESPVTITIQFLDEDGLEEGKPITVIHFADESTELLEGSKVQGGSTTFKMESFSEIAVGYGVENVKVPLDEAIDYDTDAFHITFHIKGDVTVPVQEETDGITSTPEEGDQKPEMDTAGENESDAGEESPVEPAESEAEEDAQGNGENSDAVSSDVQHVTGTTEGDVFTAPVETEGLDKDFEFKVESLDESSEEYEAVVAYGEEIGDEGEELLLQVWSYSLNYDGEEVDLSDCEVIAEITPTQPLLDAAKEAAVMAIGETQGSGMPEISGEDQGQQDGFVVSAIGLSADAEIYDIETSTISEYTEEEGIQSIFVRTYGSLAARASGQPNPKFTVQYYANLEKVAYNDASLKVTTSGSNTNELPVIDTTGGKLPKNGKGTTNSPNGVPIRNLYVDTTTGKLKTKKELTKVYDTRPFEYHKAPTINYINAVAENPSYELKEVWVLKEGKEADSIKTEDWVSYPYNEDLHFTNRKTSATENYVYISEGATLRLVYDTKKFEPDIGAAFYDYDLGDGKIYASKANADAQRNGKNTSTQGNGTWYMHTTESGINSPKNYTGSGAKLAFGNSNTGSGLQYQNWKGNLLNKFNGTQDNNPKVDGSYKGCTFGLADKLSNGMIQYATGVNAPKLFNDGDAAGKEAYTNYSLKFNQVGDTYTLKAVNGTNANNLEVFRNPDSHNWKGEATTHYHIWTNSFWPMDSAPSYGTDGHDMRFGNYGNKSKYNFSGTRGSKIYSGAPASGTFPWSDDDIDHNSYFGMHYQVDFDLVADYVGPLEYYFFGDDDMWVFLSSGDNEEGQLVCDIGGVHSSVGEYLNLWDYIDKEKEKLHRHEDSCYTNGENNPPTCGYVDQKKFTLDFFYTERGESGSTCWMQFTLPSVSSKTPETTSKDYGHLMIQKDVKVVAGGKDYPQKDLFEGTEQGEFFDTKEYTFTLSLTGPNGNLKDDYAYTKYDRNGKPVISEDGSSGGILEWETIANGETFTLKDGEYIRIQYLPAGTKYTITEMDGVTVDGVVYIDTSISADDKKQDGSITKETDKKVINGTIPADDVSEVNYINRYNSYSLPETGGSGTILYTMVGGMIVLFGVGFLYKKKFRERRG